MLVGRIRFNRVWSMLLLLGFSGSPESRTQRYAVISRVRATGPRLPFANVVLAPVGTAGLEPALSCSQGTRAAAALHPVMQSAAADSNRGHRRAAVVLLAPAPAARVPGRDTQASLRSVSSSCGSRTRVRALKGRDPLPIDERAISARTVHAVDTLGQRAPFTQWVGRCSNPGHRRAAVVALVFSQVLHHLSYRPNEKSLMSL